MSTAEGQPEAVRHRGNSAASATGKPGAAGVKTGNRPGNGLVP
jgi:hypothetical protein